MTAREYKSTHGWITFTVDLSSANYQLWYMLGEAQSKCKHIAGAPLLPDEADRLHQVYLAKGVLATTAIEGNTLTEEQVLQHLEGNLELPPSQEYLGVEVDNIVEAYNQIAERVLEAPSTEFSSEDLKHYNLLVLKDLELEDGVIPGEFRDYSVTVGGVYRGAPARDVQYLMDELCEWLNHRFMRDDVEGSWVMAFGILKAIIAHLYIAWIHPFGDGNGRTARLLELQILLSVGVPMAAAHLLSNHYNRTRTEYYRKLELSHRNEGGVLAFIEYALQGLVDGLQEQIDLVKGQQLRVHWINYVYSQFRNRDSTRDNRLRRLVLALSDEVEPVPIAAIPHLSPKLAESYAGLTGRTLKRDVDRLEAMRLLVRTGKGVRARTEIVRAFLSRARTD